MLFDDGEGPFEDFFRDFIGSWSFIGGKSTDYSSDLLHRDARAEWNF